MPTRALANRVKQTSASTGTGNFDLLGTVEGFRTFASAYSAGTQFTYLIALGSEWEMGVGVLSSGQLVRQTVIDSSNSGSLVNFSAGNKTVLVTAAQSDLQLVNSTARALFAKLGDDLDAAWTALEAGIASPAWFGAVANNTKRTAFMSALRETCAVNALQPVLNGFSIPGGTYPSTTNAFYGGILMQDGRVFLVPSNNNTSARIYDPVTNTVTTPTPTFDSSGAVRLLGGCLLSDGRVFLTPYNATSAYIYNPTTDSAATVAGFPGAASFASCTLLPDGRVFLVPYNSTTARIFDPATSTISTPVGTFPSGSNTFLGGVLLPDGRVFCVPYSSTTARIFNPVDGSVSTPTGSYPGGTAYFGGVLLPDGRVFCIPSNTTSARIYDPAADATYTPGGTYTAVSGRGGCLMPDGRVFMASSASDFRVYDPEADTLTTLYQTGVPSFGAVTLRDGRIFACPTTSATARIYQPRDASFPDTIALSPFFNRV